MPIGTAAPSFCEPQSFSIQTFNIIPVFFKTGKNSALAMQLPPAAFNWWMAV